MKQINVIDFDKTLIPFDSFRLYIKKGIKKLNFSVIFYTILRVSRLIGNSKYKQKLIKLVILNQTELKSFEAYLLSCVNVKILDKLKQHTDENSINILCSASPDFYISKVAEKLDMIGHGSFFIDEKKFHHMYEKNKVEFIQQTYPKELYHYKYAISDSETDIELLSLFEEFELIK